MRVSSGRGARVRRGMYQQSATLARVYPGAVLRLRRRGRSSSCPLGWMERAGGGFVCAEYLKRTSETEPHPAPTDEADILKGLDAYQVVGGRSLLYHRLKDIKRRRPHISLRAGSILIVQRKLVHRETAFFETRGGWYVEAEHLKKLPPPVVSLGVSVDEGQPVPDAIVIAPNAHIYSSPEENGSMVGELERWSAMHSGDDEPFSVKNGWIRLEENKYIKDEDVARFRQAPRPKYMEYGEKWIAVDLSEQLFHAYEGDRLVRVIPCSTGVKNNTEPGRYRIQWKRRMQTMRMRRGRLRVEDVQWVMYYHRREGIAIHTAYWHQDFGKPVSHGCVNLPSQDARWVFEWSAPHAFPEDSERFPSPGEPGSRVIVFR